ncbi:MAG: two-component regulator propeller domain-containing protein [Candidatus Aminicenantes bacterium]|jgi:signal transduction histidine kinase/ligand-binding sensor domain-containing protein/CheY-like chemotaxis protein
MGCQVENRLYKYILMLFLIQLNLSFLYTNENKAAEEYSFKFKHLTVREGISHNRVNCILQDRKGFMWFGTQEGLNRYDGYQVAVYLHQTGDIYSLNDNQVRSLFEDRQGVLWVGTDGGLNKYNWKRDRFTGYQHDGNDPNSLSSNAVRVIYEDKAGVLWIGTRYGGLNRFNRQKGQFARFQNNPDDPASLSNNFVTSIYEDRNGVLWIGTRAGLNQYDRQGNRFIRYRHNPSDAYSLSSNRVNAIYEDKSGRLWIGTEDSGLNRFDRPKEQFIHYRKSPENPNSLTSDSIHFIFEDRAGRLWIGTNSGLNLLLDEKGGTFLHYQTYFDDPDSLSSNWIRSIYQDVQGLLWIGTRGGGINILDKKNSKFNHYWSDLDDPNSLSDNTVFSIYQDSSGVLWIGTMVGGLNKFDRNTNTFTHFQANPHDSNTVSNDSIRAVTGSKTGMLWIGTQGGGLDCFDPDREIFFHYKHRPHDPHSISDNFITVIYEDRAGVLWIGTRRGGLNRFDSSSRRFNHYKNNPRDPHSISHNFITAIYEDRSGMLWVGTDEGGLNQLDCKKDKFICYKSDANNPNSLSNNRIKSIYEDSKGVLWIGTRRGLNKFERDKNQWSAYTVKDGLPDNMIYGILEDSQANLWLSTNNGLAKFNPQQETMITYSVNDGIQGEEYNTGAYYKNPLTGEMFFGGMNGFNSFYPDQVRDNTYIPPVVITSIKTANSPKIMVRPIDGMKAIHLSHRDNSFSITFAALNYKNPEENQYAYILEGVDPGWVYCGTQRSVTYNDLEGGTYMFRVIGSNDDGAWNREGAAVKFFISSPPWGTWWFQFLVIIALLGVIYSIHRLRVNAIESRKIKLESLVNKRTHELKNRQEELAVARETAEKERRAAEQANQFKSDFLARMSHEIRTPMNAIIGFSEMLLDTDLGAEQLEYAITIARSSESLLTLINDILDFSKVESGQLTLESIDFDPEVMAFDVCELVKPKLGAKPVEIICRISNKVPSNVKGDPGRFRQVLVNLMGNAVKFTKIGEIELSIDVEKKNATTITLHAAVRDTGIGIPRDKQKTIFNAFHQVDGSTTRKYGGSGLGLAICKQLSKLMGGDIWVESEEGKGSTFHFITLFKRSEKKSPKRVMPASLSGKKVLIVDDNLHNLEILTHLLTAAGMKVEALSRGKEAMPALSMAARNQEPFDLCVLDIRMPEVNGYDVARQIRGPDSPCPHLPLVAFTSSYSRRSKIFIDSGFDGYLPKPVQKKKLIELLERLLGESKEGGEKTKRENMITRHSILDDAKQSTRILVAEDNPINQKLANYLLTKAGYQVEMVSNGKEAVDLYRTNPDKFDIIFMDVQMPGMDGKEAARLLRTQGYREIPIIALTAQAMKGDREKCLKAGMNDYISKPIKREVVFEMVKKWTLKKE